LSNLSIESRSSVIAKVRVGLTIKTKVQALARVKEILSSDPVLATPSYEWELNALTWQLPKSTVVDPKVVSELAPRKWKTIINTLGNAGLRDDVFANVIARSVATTPRDATKVLKHIESAPASRWNTMLRRAIEAHHANVVGGETIEGRTKALGSLASLGNDAIVVPAITTHLQWIRRYVDESPAPTDRLSQSLRSNTLELIDRNLLRIAGKLKGDKGYENFPDYGEVGEVISNVSILESISTPSGTKVVTW
jgi:hypothetical protein